MTNLKLLGDRDRDASASAALANVENDIEPAPDTVRPVKIALSPLVITSGAATALGGIAQQCRDRSDFLGRHCGNKSLDVAAKRSAIEEYKTSLSACLKALSIEEALKVTLAWVITLEDTPEGLALLQHAEMEDLMDLTNPAIVLALMLKDSKGGINDKGRRAVYGMLAGESSEIQKDQLRALFQSLEALKLPKKEAKHLMEAFARDLACFALRALYEEKIEETETRIESRVNFTRPVYLGLFPEKFSEDDDFDDDDLDTFVTTGRHNDIFEIDDTQLDKVLSAICEVDTRLYRDIVVEIVRKMTMFEKKEDFFQGHAVRAARAAHSLTASTTNFELAFRKVLQSIELVDIKGEISVKEIKALLGNQITVPALAGGINAHLLEAASDDDDVDEDEERDDDDDDDDADADADADEDLDEDQA